MNLSQPSNELRRANAECPAPAGRHAPNRHTPNTWSSKFGHAFRGVKRGFRGHSSFFVHVFAAAAVMAAALTLGVSLLEGCILIGCVTAVFVAEMFNSAIEETVRGLTDEYREQLRDGLDIASAAVLIASLGAALIGAVIFLNRLGLLLGWWAGAG